MTARPTLEQARAAKQKAAIVFRDIVGDVAVGITSLGGDAYGLKVNLTSPPDEGVTLPTEVDGVPVQIDVVGKIRKR